MLLLKLVQQTITVLNKLLLFFEFSKNPLKTNYLNATPVLILLRTHSLLTLI